MASISGGVWAIDVGNNSLKALHLSDVSGAVEVIGFDNIQHGKILTGSGVKAAEREELIALSLRQFVGQNDLGRDDVIVSVPSQNSFARFVNLPPVEAKRIPEIVKFEAAQQIPFDIDDVQWDWQLMTEAGGPETRVGIFAIKNDVVSSELDHFSRENIQIRYVQMAPMALYNYILYDRPDLFKSNNQALIVLNIGAENTDLVVCTMSSVWQRCIPMGGNAFTKAIAETFKLNFEKAEKLKRTAPMSKYARQIYQAMKPVFTDLASEVQRSLGFYSSSNPNIKVTKIIALGGGTKMRGLLKYLQQTLQIPIERPDSFTKLAMNPNISTAKFHESVSDFGIVYGLALQGLGLGRIESNLLPRSIARSMTWAAKTRYFTAAAIIFLLVSIICLARANLDRVGYAKNNALRQNIKNIINIAEQARTELQAQESKASRSEAAIQKSFDIFNYRDVVPQLYKTIISALPNERNNPEQKELYEAFDQERIEDVLKVPRRERKQIFITSMSISFTEDIVSARFGETDFVRGTVGRKGANTATIPYGMPMPGMYSMPGMDQSKSKFALKKSYQERDRKREGGQEEEVAEIKPGFVVTTAGYCTNKDIGEIFDPAGVEGDKKRWGFITRLMNLQSIVDGNCPFELYKKTNADHFKLEKGVVDLTAEIPAGIGIRDVRAIGKRSGGRESSTEEILIDPMTKEIISRVAELDEYGKEKIDKAGNVVYKDNDSWFILDAKFFWKNAPKGVKEPAMQPVKPVITEKPTKTKKPASPKGRKSKQMDEIDS